jgi:hypothetical protein
MKLLFLHLPTDKQKDTPEKLTVITVEEPEHNINEGSEFLDDAIRTVDQPLIYIEESVAATYKS